MKFIRVKHLSGGSSFVALYNGEDDISKGEIVVNSKNQQLVVTGEVPQAWMDAYGNPKCMDVRRENE